MGGEREREREREREEDSLNGYKFLIAQVDLGLYIHKYMASASDIILQSIRLHNKENCILAKAYTLLHNCIMVRCTYKHAC
jgi:hypothetical protein